jgi:enterochelin esterase-like enzyme
MIAGDRRAVLRLDNITARGVVAAEDMPSATVFAGFSLGALPAQKLAQTRPGALGAVLYHGGVPADTFGVPGRPRSRSNYTSPRTTNGASSTWHRISHARHRLANCTYTRARRT